MNFPAIRDLIALVREELPYRGVSAPRWAKLADEAAAELSVMEAVGATLEAVSATMIAWKDAREAAPPTDKG